MEDPAENEADEEMSYNTTSEPQPTLLGAHTKQCNLPEAFEILQLRGLSNNQEMTGKHL